MRTIIFPVKTATAALIDFRRFRLPAPRRSQRPSQAVFRVRDPLSSVLLVRSLYIIRIIQICFLIVRRRRLPTAVRMQIVFPAHGVLFDLSTDSRLLARLRGGASTRRRRRRRRRHLRAARVCQFCTGEEQGVQSATYYPLGKLHRAEEYTPSNTV